jgi:hypothetical protein
MQRYRMRTAAGERDHLHHGGPPERESACRARILGKGRAVAFAGSKEAGGFANAAHFAGRGEVVGYVEEDLVGEGDVEGGVGEREAVRDVGGLES